MLIGIIEHKFDIMALQEVRKKYDKLDMVPTHYNYPELYYL